MTPSSVTSDSKSFVPSTSAIAYHIWVVRDKVAQRFAAFKSWDQRANEVQVTWTSGGPGFKPTSPLTGLNRTEKIVHVPLCR